MSGPIEQARAALGLKLRALAADADGPVEVVSLSGGYDSTAMALRLSEVEPAGARRWYVCTPTGDELPAMRAHWTALEQALGAPIHRLTLGTLDDWIAHWAMLPNSRARWCTRVLKIQPDCARCPFQRLHEWWSLWRDHPDVYAHAEKQETAIGHTFRSAQRDSWPADLGGMRARFERGERPAFRGPSPYNLPLFDAGRDDASSCRVCRL